MRKLYTFPNRRIQGFMVTVRNYDDELKVEISSHLLVNGSTWLLFFFLSRTGQMGQIRILAKGERALQSLFISCMLQFLISFYSKFWIIMEIQLLLYS